MTLRPITPEDTKRRVAQGARLIDVRERDEHAREHIPGATCLPVARIPHALETGADDVIFHCRSGARTQAHAPLLAAAVNGTAYMLDGGIDAWKRAGFAVERTPNAPLEIMRQVQIAAGMLVLIGILLGAFVAPGFLALSAFVGAGLVFAGTTGWCGMAKLLMAMPWNRLPGGAAPKAAG